ncbi:MAG: alpha/beta fold hydrolase [Pirellulales bacterium]
MLLFSPIAAPSTARRADRAPALFVVLLAIAVVTSTGCLGGDRGVSLRKSPYNALTEQLKLVSHGGPEATERTQQILRRYDLKREITGDWQPVIAKLQEINVQEPQPEVQYSIAELSYIAGKKAELTAPDRAVDLYGTAVANAYLYLFDDQLSYLRNPYDPQFRGACDLYNQSLEGALRIMAKRGLLKPGASHRCTVGGHSVDLTVAIRAPTWQADDFDRFEFVNDYEVKGLTNQYHTYGLGVPLIAIREKKTTGAPTERYYPPDLSFPVTAFLRIRDQRQDREMSASLELYDPLANSDTRVKGRAVPLQSDLSTPLAYFLNNPAFRDNDIATAGLLHPGDSEKVKGLYMLEPYQPGKIPVVMVHGLWSSPLTWMQMFNDLRSLPEIRDRYQFWFYLYPSGQPFWISAAQFREELALMRQNIDPRLEEPALGQMVLVGHSMGGLVSKLQTLTSADDYWKIVSDRPFSDVKGPPEAKEAVERVVYFQANPSVRRVITLGTPHRGSNFASGPTRWLASWFIKLPEMITGTSRELRRDNPGLFRDTTMIDISTSIDSLSPDSPILPVMLATPTPPWVKYHNVVGVVETNDWKSRLAGKIAGRGDGVVAYESAHLDNVASEIVVPADHLHVHSHPRSVLEVRRILLEHLSEMDNTRRFDPLRQVQPASTQARRPTQYRSATRSQWWSGPTGATSAGPRPSEPRSSEPRRNQPSSAVSIPSTSRLPTPNGWLPWEQQ